MQEGHELTNPNLLTRDDAHQKHDLHSMKFLL